MKYVITNELVLIVNNLHEHSINLHWNALPKEVMQATSINQFKNRYDRHYALLHLSYNSEARRLRLIQLDS